MRFLVFLLALIWAYPSFAWGHRHGGGTPIPAAASGVGYTIHSLGTSKFTTSNVDTAKTYVSGFQWYIFNFYGTNLPTNTVTLNADGTISVTGNSSNAGIASLAYIASAPNYIGHAFGCGFYATAEISFDPTAVVLATGWPSWWSDAAENFVPLAGVQWSGQVAGYNHFAELDQFEFNRDQSQLPGAYGGTIIDWYGQFNITCGGYCNVTSNFNLGSELTPQGTDFSQFHRAAVLWVPATVSTNGYVTFYWDDIPHDTISWSQFTSQPPPPTATTPWTFGVIDNDHMVLVFGSGNTPINVKSVDLWQGLGACNISN